MTGLFQFPKIFITAAGAVVMGMILIPSLIIIGL